MCGVAAIMRRDSEMVAPSDLRRMCSAIAHRGPDDAGFALFEQGRLGLGHVRLSIVDLGGGHQPIYNEDLSIAVICNGEIYDYPQLRQELLDKGHRFRTTSDSELLVHLYEEHGADLLARLRGEFAFILWDGARHQLLAARDPCGVKPLYYRAAPDALYLCSEAKGILALKEVERKLSVRNLLGPALGIYLDDACAFEGIQSLKPGHYLLAGPDGALRETEYHRPRFDVREEMTFAEATSGIRERLTAAVRRRLAADVPVHAYLSGGIDSTIVCGLMTRAGANFTCFNVGFPDSPYDESEKASRIAAHFGQKFETVPCNQELIAENVVQAVFCAETPLNNYNSIAKILLSRYVRSRGEKVCMTGEGADELFAGYPYFKLEMLWRMWQLGGESERSARQLHEKFRRLEYRSEGLLWNGSERWRRATRIFGYPSHFHLRARDANKCVRNFYNAEALGLTRDDTPENVLRSSIRPERLEGLDPFNKTRLLTFNQLYNLVIPLLGDRVEMINSLECRPPFLDQDLLDFACRIPPRHFIDLERLREKNLLREAFADLLPPVFQTEHKHPFLAPTWSSIGRTQAGRDLFEDYLSPSSIREAGIFRPLPVRLLRALLRWCPLNKGFRRKIDALVGTMLTTQILHRKFIASHVPSNPYFRMIDRSPKRIIELKQAA